jgi:hypothetical protein
MKMLLGVCVVLLIAVPVVGLSGAAPPFLLMWGSAGQDPGEFSGLNLRYLAADEQGNVYVPGNGVPASVDRRIQVFDADGEFLRQFSTYAQHDQLLGIVIDGQGDILVLNRACSRVERYDKMGTFSSMWGWGVLDGSPTLQSCSSGTSCKCGSSGGGAGQLDDPWAIAADADGNVYVAERDNSRVTMYDSTDNFVRTWGWGVQDGTVEFQVCSSGCQAGISGSNAGQFDLPSGIDVLGDTVYVTDWNNNRIQLFSRAGVYQSEFAVPSAPAGVSVSPDGDIYVVSYWGDEVRVFDSGGTQLAIWGVSGSGIGEFANPFDVAVTPGGDVFVTDQGNSRIQKFGPPLRAFKADVSASAKPLLALSK